MLLSGCGNATKKPPLTITEYVKEPIVCPNPPLLDNPEWLRVKWLLGTNDATQEKVMSLDEDGYQNLSTNSSNALKMIEDLLQHSNYYKLCLTAYNSEK
jgi:hypothetical protein